MRGLLEVQGRVRVPGDKSVSHRALMLSALAMGPSTIRGILESEDVHSTATALRALGWPVPAIASDMRVTGSGLQSPERSALRPLDCGNSGTTTRLTAGIAAAQHFASTFTGDASLSRRPMRRVAAPLEAMGARVEWLEAPDRLPMRVHGGALTPVAWELDVASAQLKSAILLAGLCGGVPVRVREPAPTRDHTEQMLRSLGVEVTLYERWIVLQPVASLPAAEWDVPGDPSSAAFFLGLAALADRGELALDHVLASPFRDGFVRTLERMGVPVTAFDAAEGAAGLTHSLAVRAGAELRAVTIAPEEVPSMIDELPLLAVLAARAQGETIVRGAAELRVKESDRIAVTVANLRAIGADAEELPDGFVVRGSNAPLRGVVEAHGDHRIAMAFGVLSASRGVDIRIDDTRCVAVSYPGFWSDLERVTHG